MIQLLRAKFQRRSASAQPSPQALLDRVALQDEKIRHLQSQLKNSFFVGASDFPGFALKFSAPLGQLQDIGLEFASPGVTRYLAATPGMLETQPSLGLMAMAAGTQQRFRRRLAVSASRLQTFTLDVQLNGSGPSRWLALTVSPQQSDGRMIWECLARDVTALHAAEANATRANQEKLLLISRLSHELRIPLNSIMGHAQLIQQSQPLAQAGDADVQSILQSCEQMSKQLTNMCDSSMLELDLLEVSERQILLLTLLHELGESHRLQAADKGLALRTRFDLPAARVQTDPVRLKQVLSTLLAHAMESCRGAPIALEAQSQLKNGRLHVTFEVRTAAPDSASEQPDGGALPPALHFVAQVADRIGGALGADTNAQGERVLSLRLNFALPKQEAAPALPPEPPLAPRTLDVLVVDDSRANRAIMRSYLLKQGHRVHEASNGLEAIAQVSSLQPDLVFMDMEMPEMDGVQACRAIRSLAAPASQTFIAAMTGRVLDSDKAEAQAAGMNDFIDKPIHFQQVERLLAMSY